MYIYVYKHISYVYVHMCICNKCIYIYIHTCCLIPVGNWVTSFTPLINLITGQCPLCPTCDWSELTHSLCGMSQQVHL